ncbi:MAG TPA: hypothetical protein VFI32_01440 [Rhodanobacteraceae bacterium]|nr:hypothetical protein [Rhodanobacteraceae bacterium]
MESNGDYEERHTVKFIETRWHDRLRKFLPFLPKEIPLFAAVTISFWGVAEVLSQIGGEVLSLRNLAIPALATALSAAVYKAIKKFRAHVPESLSTESKASQSIYRKGKRGWQFALALQMLEERINSSDLSLQRIESGASFIAPQHLDEMEYVDWIKRRPEILIRLLRAVAIQSTHELPTILSDPSSKNFLIDLKDSIIQLASLYKETVDFELKSRSVSPPDNFEKAHAMIYGWSGAIRNGIREFLGVLKQISVLDPNDPKNRESVPPSFAIEFKSPANIDAFIQELGRLR